MARLPVKGRNRLVEPLFPKDYAWDGPERVETALAKLHKDTTDELWEESPFLNGGGFLHRQPINSPE